MNRRLLPYLQLVRLPNVFTAAADSLAGWLLARGTFAEPGRWLPLLGASMSIYAAGIALNDYFDHAIEGTEIYLPRNMGAYGYRDDNPLAFGRTEAVGDYLRQRFEMLALQVPAAREYFLSYRLVLQMLDDGFDVAAWLHDRGIAANVWTLDYRNDDSLRVLESLRAIGIDRITTNTAPAWESALAATARAAV